MEIGGKVVVGWFEFVEGSNGRVWEELKERKLFVRWVLWEELRRELVEE